MECVQSSIRVNTDVLLPHRTPRLKHTQKHKRFRGKTVSVFEICSELYMLWSAGFQWRLTCTLILRTSKKQSNEDSGDLPLLWCVFFFQTKKISLFNEMDPINQYVPCPLPTINLHRFLSRNKERQKKKVPEKERNHPTIEDLHESCHLTLIDSNYHTNTISWPWFIYIYT